MTYVIAMLESVLDFKKLEHYNLSPHIHLTCINQSSVLSSLLLSYEIELQVAAGGILGCVIAYLMRNTS